MEVPEMTVKEQLRQLADDLPDNATLEEVMERLYLLVELERRDAEIEAGQGVSNEEARKRIEAKWRG